MGIVWSLVTALIYGSADFCGGVAARRQSVAAVMLGAHGLGLVGVTVASVLLADAFTWRDFGLGAAGGFSGLVGVVLLYRRLALGPMHVVAPLSAVSAAVVPAVWGLATGERLAGLAWFGVALAIAAIVLVSASGTSGGAEAAPVTWSVVGESLLSGVGFGGFFILLDATEAATAPWPVVGSRVLSVGLLVAFALVRGSRPSGSVADWWVIAGAGLGDTAANVTFLWATQSGDLTVVSVLAGLYPVATVVLAAAIFGDRMTRRQLIGFATAMAATVLIAAG